MRRKKNIKHSRYAKRKKAYGTYPLSNIASLAAVAESQDDTTAKNLVRAAYYSQDPDLAQTACEYLGNLVMEKTLNPDPFAPPVDADEAVGEIVLGTVINSDCAFGLCLFEIVRHVLITGSTGFGKTTLITRLLKETIHLARHKNKKISIQVFDIKRDYRKLHASYPQILLFTLPGKSFRWNPLEPPIKDWRRWAGIFAASFANSCGFYGGMGTENYLYKYLLVLYSKYDPANGLYPCLLDLLDYLHGLKDRKKIDRYGEEYQSYSRILNRVESLCYSFGETINCSCGYSLAKVLDNDVVYDLAELKPDAQTFFTETFLTQSVWYRIETGQRGGSLRNLAVFDEAKQLMPKYRETSQQAIANMSHNVAMGREFGVGFVVGECDPSLLANSIKANCYARFCFNQSSNNDIRDSAASLGLNAEQAGEFQNLDIGQAIVRLAGRIGRPFVLQVTP